MLLNKIVDIQVVTPVKFHRNSYSFVGRKILFAWFWEEILGEMLRWNLSTALFRQNSLSLPGKSRINRKSWGVMEQIEWIDYVRRPYILLAQGGAHWCPKP
jgi:hypothetical protein